MAGIVCCSGCTHTPGAAGRDLLPPCCAELREAEPCRDLVEQDRSYDLHAAAKPAEDVYYKSFREELLKLNCSS